MSGKVYYINKDKEVRFLSNFSKHPVVIDGKRYATSEHYFQAAKFFNTDPKWAEEIRNSPNPAQAAKMGNDRSHKIQPKWDEEWAMYHMGRVLLAKALQNKLVKEQILETGDAYIVERAPWDAIWGDGKNGDGRNQLGRLWIRVRNRLREEKNES